MAESIGNLYSTKIPSLSETADIQEAFRLYHYGAPSGTGVGEYDPTNSNAANLVNPSIAYTLNSLQSQISSISGTLGVQASTWSAKGVIVTATAPSTVSALLVGTNGQVLTANSGTSTGLEWATPEVTLANTATLTNKTLTGPKITSGSFIGDSNGNELILFPSTVASAVNEITVSNAATGNKPTISATGGDTNITLNLVSKGTGTVQANGVDLVTLSATQTLTNKTLTAPTVTQLFLSDSTLVFEGSTANDFETTLTVVDPTADRTITLPNITGTVITTGDTGTVTSTMIADGTIVNADINASAAIDKTKISGTAITAADTGTVTNAMLAGSIANAKLTNSAITVNGTAISLGASGTITAANPNALTIGTGLSGTSYSGASAVTIAIDSTVATLTGSQTLTNKTLTSPTINTPALALSTSSSTTDARISWDTTNKKIQVGNGTTAIDFAPSTLAGAGTSVTLTTNNYNLVLGDKDKLIEVNNTVASTVTIPLNSSQAYPVGTQIHIVQTGAGQVTVQVTSGVTLNCAPQGTANTAKLRAQWSSITLIKRATDTWLAVGDLTQ